MTPILSIVVPSFNRLYETDACVRTLIARKKPGSWNTEIIIVDDGSTDGTGQYFANFESPGLQEKGIAVRAVVTDKATGTSRNPGFARNAGLKAARGEIVAFVDCDITHSTDPISATEKEFSLESDVYVTGVFFRAMIGPEKCVFDGPRGATGDMPHGGWLAAPRAELIKIGGYDERYQQYGNEDHDMVQRLRRHGLKHRISPHILYSHPHQYSTGRDKSSSALTDFQMDIQRNDTTVVRNVGKEWGYFSPLESTRTVGRQSSPASSPNAIAARHPAATAAPSPMDGSLLREILFTLEHVKHKVAGLDSVPNALRNIQAVTTSLDVDIFKGASVKSSIKVFGGHAFDQLLATTSFRRILLANTPDATLAEALRSASKQVEEKTVADSDETAASTSPYDVVWTSALHRVRNPGVFIDNLKKYLIPGGTLVINAPCANNALGSGNLTMWNAGLIIYNLVRAGIDCKHARVCTTKTIVSVIVTLTGRYVPPDISFNTLGDFFPIPIAQHFDGRISLVNWR